MLAVVDVEALPGVSDFGALTVRECPPRAKDWHHLRRVFFKRLRRLDLVHYIVNTEWQPREKERARAVAAGLSDPGGVPHLHPLLWWRDGEGPGGAAVKEAWREVAGDFGVDLKGQCIEAARSEEAVVAYNLKHGYRAVKAVQRDEANAPRHWIDNGGMGAMWSKSTGLPFVQEIRRRDLTRKGLECLRESMARMLALDVVQSKGEEAGDEVYGKLMDRPLWQGLNLWVGSPMPDWVLAAYGCALRERVVGAGWPRRPEWEQEARAMIEGRMPEKVQYDFPLSKWPLD